MKVKEKTKGQLKREKSEKEREVAKQNEKIVAKQKKAEKEYKDALMSKYRDLVTKNFLSIFTRNYGDGYDINSLINSLTFDFKMTKNGLQPSFVFNEKEVKFKSDYNEDNDVFNENQWEDFISNRELKIPNLSKITGFQTLNQFKQYEQDNIKYSELANIDNVFIPISNFDRFSKYNKINKKGGYTSKIKSGELANKEIQRQWVSMQKKVVKEVIK